MPEKDSDSEATLAIYTVGFYAAVLTTIITLITFGLAITAIPISGANCREGCITYPYLDTVSQFPRDYQWMLPAIGLVLVYVVLMVAIFAFAPTQRKLFGHIGLLFALIASVTLLIDYFVQFSVVPISLMNNETEGITLITQYNSHGLFIALEELGYLMMSLSFLFMAFVFSTQNRLEAIVRRIFMGGFVLAGIALITVSMIYGLDRQDRFEVIIISIDWLVLLVNSILLSVMFRRGLNTLRSAQSVNSVVL
jgi:hypothetical protein